MSRLAAAGFFAIIGCVGLVAYRVAEPSHLYVEQDNRDVLETIAAGSAAMADALTPTKTPYMSPTPTGTPKPATNTPLPTYYPEASPGIRMVPQWTEVPPAAEEVNAELPPCATVTPRPYVDTNCEVRDVPD